MRVNKDKIIEGCTAITIWITPWVIVGITFALYRDQLSIEQLTKNGSIYIICGVSFSYFISSFSSFVGFVLPIFEGKISALYLFSKPKYEASFSSLGRKLLRDVKNDNSRLAASVITIHDYLNSVYENSSRSQLVRYIPSISQMKRYPYESLCLMLSAQKCVDGLDSGKYYNFNLIISVCLSK
mgnify:CR=1 FL=1